MNDSEELLDEKHLRNVIQMMGCIYVQDADTRLKAHVYGHSSSKPGGPLVMTTENTGEVFAHAASSVTIAVENGLQVSQVLLLVEEIKGHHEFTNDWTETGD